MAPSARNLKRAALQKRVTKRATSAKQRSIPQYKGPATKPSNRSAAARKKLRSKQTGGHTIQPVKKGTTSKGKPVSKMRHSERKAYQAKQQKAFKAGKGGAPIGKAAPKRATTKKKAVPLKKAPAKVKAAAKTSAAYKRYQKASSSAAKQYSSRRKPSAAQSHVARRKSLMARKSKGRRMR